MKLQMMAAELAKMVSVVAQAISSKPMKPENECVYMSVSSDSGIPLVTMICTDGGMAIQKVTDAAKVLDDGCAMIPAKTLLNYVKLMDGEVIMEVNEKHVCTLKCGKKRVSIVCMDPEGAALKLTDIPNAKTVTMNGSDFGTLVSSVSHCIGADQGRMVLTGINFVFDAEKGYAEATGLDGFRLAIRKKGAETNDSFSALIPATSAKLIAKTIGNAENVDFRFGSGIAIAEAYDTAIEVSLLSGEYIDVQKLIFRGGNMRVKVNTKELSEAVKLAMISAGVGQKSLIVLSFNEDGASMKVFARSDKSDANSDIYCEAEGSMKNGAGNPETEIAFNGEYLMDAANAMDGFSEEITLILKTPGSPMAMIPVGHDDYYQLVLPVRRM